MQQSSEHQIILTGPLANQAYSFQKPRLIKDLEESNSEIHHRKQIIISSVAQLNFKYEFVENVMSSMQVDYSNQNEMIASQIYQKIVENFDNQDFNVEEEKSLLQQISYPFNVSINILQMQSEPQVDGKMKLEEQDQPRINHRIGPKIYYNKKNENKPLANDVQIQNVLMEFSESSQSAVPEEVQSLCLICYSLVQQNQMNAVASCGHKFCNDCNNGYLEECIRNSNVLRVNCPMDGCKEELTEEIIKTNVNAQMWQKFLEFKRRRIIQLNPNVRWCPRRDCTNYVVGGGSSNKLTCQCGQQICFDCGNPWHQSLSCKDAIDAQYKEAQQEFKIYPCPKCRAPIQKKSGCNHMTCYMCQHQFCWVCFGQYSKIHYALWNLCGCILPGGQFISTDPWTYAIYWRILMAIPKLIGFLILLCILLLILPFVFIIQAFILPYRFYVKYYNNYGISILPLQFRIVYWLIFFFLGIILLPLSALIIICPLSCIQIYKAVLNRL